MQKKQLHFLNSESIKEIRSNKDTDLILTIHETSCYIYMHNSLNKNNIKQKYYTEKESITSSYITSTNLFLGFENGLIILIDLNNENPPEYLIHHTGKVLDLKVRKNNLYSSAADGKVIQLDLMDKKMNKIYSDIKEPIGNPHKLAISLCGKYLMTILTNNILNIFFTNSDTSNYENIIKPNYSLDLNKMILEIEDLKGFFYGIFIILFFDKTILILNPNYTISGDFVLINQTEVDCEIIDVVYYSVYYRGFNNFLIICNSKILLIDLYENIIHKIKSFDKMIKSVFVNKNIYYIFFDNGEIEQLCIEISHDKLTTGVDCTIIVMCTVVNNDLKFN